MSDQSTRLPVVRSGQAGAIVPVFERMAIVGLDGLGAALALACRRAWPTALVIGVDWNDVLESAVRLHAIDVASHDLAITSEADLVVLAGRPDENLAVLPRLAGCLNSAAVVTDIGPLSGPIVQAARNLPPQLAFVAGHPLASPASSSIAEATPDVVSGIRWLVVVSGSESPAAVDRLSRFISGLGALPRCIDLAIHDRTFAQGTGWENLAD